MIHYHGTPCGGTREEVSRFLAGRHALIPWIRQEDLPVAAEVCESFMLDNGAFSAFTSGNPIKDWSGYYDWVQEWARHPAFEFAVIPDEIDGEEGDNDKLLAQWYKRVPLWVRCAPVWHLDESLERLARLVDTHKSQRVCFGSSGQYWAVGSDRWWDRMCEAMTVCCDEHGRPKCRLHGLRMLDPAIFHRLPLSSADSTNAVRNGSNFRRFGMYCPPTLSQRQDVIAGRIEAHQSAAVWVPRSEQGVLCLSNEIAPHPAAPAAAGKQET